MKCMLCGSPATVFITETVNGKTTQTYLCENCARHREENLYRQSRQQSRVKEVVCPNCKTRLSEFLKTGFLGCPDCYRAFGSTINELLPKIQGKTRHVPRKHMGNSTQSRLDVVNQLKYQMDKASKEMRYDDAEKIFKQLKSMGEL